MTLIQLAHIITSREEEMVQLLTVTLVCVVVVAAQRNGEICDASSSRTDCGTLEDKPVFISRLNVVFDLSVCFLFRVSRYHRGPVRREGMLLEP